MMNGEHAYLLRGWAATRVDPLFSDTQPKGKGRLVSGALNPQPRIVELLLEDPD